MTEKMPLTRAFLWIFLSTLVISGSATLGWLYYLHVVHDRGNDLDYTILAVVDTGPEGQKLPVEYLCAILGLSADNPTNLYAYDLKRGKKALLDSPLIKTVILKRAPPDALYVEYTTYEPVARLGDYENCAMDEEGFVFPYKPFFEERHLPELYLGLAPFGTAGGGYWNEPVCGERFELALELLEALSRSHYFEGMAVEKIDVSKAFSGSCGQREIVVQVEDVQDRFRDGEPFRCYSPKTLRLSCEGWREELKNYKVLRSYLCSQEISSDIEINRSTAWLPILVVDMRLPQMAFLGEYK